MHRVVQTQAGILWPGLSLQVWQALHLFASFVLHTGFPVALSYLSVPFEVCCVGANSLGPGLPVTGGMGP